MTRVVAQSLTSREDIVTDGEIADDVVATCCSVFEDHYFVVPKVVE